MRGFARFSFCLGLGLTLAAPLAAQEPVPVGRYEAVSLPAGPLCAKCVAKMPKRVPADPRDISMANNHGAHSGCATCPDSAPGLAYVGGSSAPGYAMVGGAHAEPAPVGVMRTSHDNPNWQGAAMSPYAGQPGPQVPAAPMGHSMTSPGHKRPSIVGHLLGVSGGESWSRKRRERDRSQHAAIRYDAGVSQVNNLPASMVYGR